jgi:hypothetical protein
MNFAEASSTKTIANEAVDLDVTFKLFFCGKWNNFSFIFHHPNPCQSPSWARKGKIYDTQTKTQKLGGKFLGVTSRGSWTGDEGTEIRCDGDVGGSVEEVGKFGDTWREIKAIKVVESITVIEESWQPENEAVLFVVLHSSSWFRLQTNFYPNVFDIPSVTAWTFR